MAEDTTFTSNGDNGLNDLAGAGLGVHGLLTVKVAGQQLVDLADALTLVKPQHGGVPARSGDGVEEQLMVVLGPHPAGVGQRLQQFGAGIARVVGGVGAGVAGRAGGGWRHGPDVEGAVVK
ncbi:MAG: hypothetical protein ACRD0U_13225, partial [Acidimicrobiales bacterium]